MSVLSVSDLRVTYGTRAGPVRAVKGVSFAIAPGRLLSIVGESGSGKSSLALAVLGALGDEAAVAGEVRYRGQDLLGMSARALRRLWGRRLAMVFQDPGGTLNPVLPVGEPVVEVLREHLHHWFAHRGRGFSVPSRVLEHHGGQQPQRRRRAPRGRAQEVLAAVADPRQPLRTWSPSAPRHGRAKLLFRTRTRQRC